MLEFADRVPDICDLSFDMDTMDSTFPDIDIKMEGLHSPMEGLHSPMEGLHSTMEDLGLDHSLFEFDTMTDLSHELDGTLTKGEKRTILDDLDTKDKIRQDCMWSTGQQLTKFFKSDPLHSKLLSPTSTLGEDLSLTPPTSYIHEYLTHFETPLPSDEESVSGDEIDVVSDWSSVIIDQENRACTEFTKDHSYSNHATLTPPESSEDEEPCSPSHTRTSRVLSTLANDRLNKAVQSILQPEHTNIKPSSKPKFVFKINIKANSKESKQINKLRWLSRHSRTSLGRKSCHSLAKSLRQGQEEDEGEKPKDARDLHNHMERQRRTELKNAFDYVKKSVPTISNSERVSKQMILDKSIDYCRSVRQKEAAMNKYRRSLQEKNSILKKKLNSLQCAPT